MNQLEWDVQALIRLPIHAGATIGFDWIERCNAGSLTRDENPESHFCVYFLPYRLRTREIFLVPATLKAINSMDWFFHNH